MKKAAAKKVITHPCDVAELKIIAKCCGKDDWDFSTPGQVSIPGDDYSVEAENGRPRSLHIRWVAIDSEALKAVGALTALKELELDQAKISDLWPLAGLTSLVELDLCGNAISDLSPLAGLTELHILRLAGNQISDLSPLAGLTALTELNLDNNNFHDLSPLAELTSLTELRCSNIITGQISDLGPLAGLTALTTLDLANNKISDLSPLAGLTALTWLHLGYNGITDYTPLMEMIGKGLDLWKLTVDPHFPLELKERLEAARVSVIVKGAEEKSNQDDEIIFEDKENNMSDITARVISRVAEALSIEASKISPESTFQDDLGVDPLAMMQLIMALEDEFAIRIEDEAAKKLKTVQKAVDFISEHLMGAVQDDEDNEDESAMTIGSVEDALEKVRDNGSALKKLPDKFKTAEVCLAAVQESGYVLRYVPENLRTPDICLAAVQESGSALEDVPEKLKTPQLCFTAVQNYGSLEDVPEKLKTPELCLAAVQNDVSALMHVPEKLKTPELCLAAVQSHGGTLMHVPEKLKTLELCLSAVQNGGEALQYVPEKLKTPELYLAAVQNDGEALQYVPEELKTPELCLAAVQNSSSALEYVSEELKTPELCLAAVQTGNFGLAFVPEELKTPELCLAAVQNYGFQLRDVPEELKTPKLCLIAVKNDSDALDFVPEELQTTDFMAKIEEAEEKAPEAGEAGAVSQKQLRFWQAVSDGLAEKTGLKSQTPKGRAQFEVSLGRTGFFLSNVLYRGGGLAVRFLLNGKDKTKLYSNLEAERKKIERELGAALTWSEPGASKLVISLAGPALNLEDEADFAPAVAWMVEWIDKFKTVFEPRVKNFQPGLGK